LATGAIFGLKVAAERALTDLREGKNQKIKEITQRAAKRLEESGEVEVLATNGGIITFNVRGVHPHDTAQILADEGVAVRAGFLCAEPFLKYKEWGPVVRASFSVFNTEMDGERLVEAVKKVRKRMGI
jgi:cysteine desulfurase